MSSEKTTQEKTAHQIRVKNIAPTTSVEELEKFFSFCGKIAAIDRDKDEKDATVTFAKPSAVNTAMMLDGGSLDGMSLKIERVGVFDESLHEEGHQDEHDEGDHDVPQSDKPRAAIAAEYIAAGYTFSDPIIQRFIDLDKKHGISSRFTSWFDSINTTVGSKVLGPDQTVTGGVSSALGGVSNKARSIDEQKGISKTANDYYSRALSSPFGKRVYEFYTTTTKQAVDIHEEAKRIAESKKAASAGSPTTSSSTGAATVPSGEKPATDASVPPTSAAPLAP